MRGVSKIAKELHERKEGVGLAEKELHLQALAIELLLDIRALLIDLHNRDVEIKIELDD